jgi:hypothetical protein
MRRRAAAVGEDELPLVCPACGARYGEGVRFCENCRLPVTQAPPLTGEEQVSARHERARKIKPQLAEGELVYAAQARNQVEGEFIQGLLLEEGIPSLLRRSAGFDVPDFLAAGPRDVIVPQSGLQAAREVLLQAEFVDDRAAARTVAPGRLLAGLLIALAFGALIVWIGTLISH